MKQLIPLVLAGLTVGAADAQKKQNPSSQTLPPPTHANVAYGPDESNVLDFWKAPTGAPNPLLVMILTPLLLGMWRRQAERGRELSVIQKMAVGALLVAASYLLVAAAEAVSGGGRAHWLWLLSYFFIFTLGELFILPNGLGIFARLAPARLGASTVAAWYLAIFSGSLVAGQVGRLWSRIGHVPFFIVLAGIATSSAALLYLLDAPTRRILGRAAHPGEPGGSTRLSEGLANA